MQIICDLFNIILFVTVAGGVFTILSLAANRVMRLTLPLWFSVCGMAAYILPIFAPGRYLIPPEAHSWIPEYYIVCGVWFAGVIFLSVYDIVRTTLAHRAIRNYHGCDDEHINTIFMQCAGCVGIKKMPFVCFGTLNDPACVVGFLHPTVILNKAIIKQLTDEELLAVLCHEVTHIKRGHIMLARIYDYICILNWFNLLAWIAKKEFSMCCETDCDHKALICLENKLTNTDYANAMIHLLGLSVVQNGNKACGMSALGFLMAKRRLEVILYTPAKAKKIIMTMVLALLLAIILLFSMWMSWGYFYPYSAYNTLPEYSIDYD